MSLLLKIFGTPLRAWAGAMVGALLGTFVGAVLGPLLGAYDTELVLAVQNQDKSPFTARFIEGLLDSMPTFVGVMTAIHSVVGGLIGGSTLGAYCGFVSGGVVGAVSGFGAWSERGLAVSPGLKASRLDHFFGNSLSRWLIGVRMRDLLGLAAGALFGAGLLLSMLQDLRSLSFQDSWIPAVFGLGEVTLIGGTVGYLTGTLCIVVQALFPWALPASALGALAAQVVGPHAPGALVPRPEVLYPYMGVAALIGHVLSLVVGPLRGRISIVREGVMAAALVGLLFSSKPLEVALLVVIVSAVAQRFGRREKDSTAATPILAMWSNVSMVASAVVSWLFQFKTLAWGVGGIIVGAFFDYPVGGVAPWFLLFGILAHQNALRARWAAAGARAQAARTASGP